MSHGTGDVSSLVWPILCILNCSNRVFARSIPKYMLPFASSVNPSLGISYIQTFQMLWASQFCRKFVVLCVRFNKNPIRWASFNLIDRNYFLDGPRSCAKFSIFQLLFAQYKSAVFQDAKLLPTMLGIRRFLAQVINGIMCRDSRWPFSELRVRFSKIHLLT